MPRTPKSQAAKAQKPEPGKPKKTSIHLDADASIMLGAASVWEDKDKSFLVNWLIRTHLSEYEVKFKGSKFGAPVIPAAVDDRQTGEHGANLSVQSGQ